MGALRHHGEALFAGRGGSAARLLAPAPEFTLSPFSIRPCRQRNGQLFAGYTIIRLLGSGDGRGIPRAASATASPPCTGRPTPSTEPASIGKPTSPRPSGIHHADRQSGTHDTKINRLCDVYA